MSYEPVPVPPLAPDKSSEERRLGENTMLEYLLRSGDITVKEEPLITTSLVPALAVNVKREWEIRTPTSQPVTKVEVIDLVDSGSDDGGDLGRDRAAATSTPRVTDCAPLDLEGPSGADTPPAAAAAAGNAEAQRTTTEQPDVPNSSSLRSSLRSVETKHGASVAREPESCEPVPSDAVQEPQCLGPFVEVSSIRCPQCSEQLTEYYQTLAHLCVARHLHSERMKKRLKCFFCEKEYGTMSCLKKHIRTYVQKRYVKCSACGTHLASVSSFRTHAPTHTNRWPYRCDVCGQGSVSEYHLKIHKTTHTDEKPWMCDVCGAMFRNKLRLTAHKTVHSDRKYECDLCFAMFKKHIHVKEHKKNVHPGRKKEFQCDECSSAFTSKQQLKYHKESKHDDNSGRQKFVCSVCDKEFIHRFKYNAHMDKHKRKNEIYTCDMCKRNFSQKSSLTRHILEHSGKQFSCNFCGMLFTQKVSVKRHISKLHSSD